MAFFQLIPKTPKNTKTMKTNYQSQRLTEPKILAFLTVDETTLRLYDFCPVTNRFSIFVLKTGKSYCLYHSACFLDSLLHFQDYFDKIVTGIEICNDCE